MSAFRRTLGELIDRLSILNIKLFMVQDELYAAKKNGEGLPAETVQKLASLNLDRSQTMTAIDQCLADAVRDGEATVDPRVKIV